MQIQSTPISYLRYTYALNNPLRFIDPSGYYNKPSDLERERRDGQGYYYNYEMAWKLGGNRTPFANAFEWGRTVGGYSYNWATGKYDNSYSGSSISASSFSAGVVPSLGGMLSPEATGRVIDALNSLQSQTQGFNILTGRSWNLPLMQARGFDNHIFQYNRATGLFYAPWTNLQVDPLAILVQSMTNASRSRSREQVTGMGISLEFAVPRWLLIRNRRGDLAGFGIDFGVVRDKNGFGSYATTKTTMQSGLAFSAQVETFTAVRNLNANMSIDRSYLRGPGYEVGGGLFIVGGSYSTGTFGPNGAFPLYNIVTLSAGPGLDYGYVEWDTKTYVSGN